MQFLVVVNCSSRKTVVPSRELSARSLKRGPLSDLVGQWRDRCGKADGVLTAAGDLYTGRAFALAASAARSVDADIRIISAGMGLLRADSRIPSYSLTVARGHADSILDRGALYQDFGARQWWEAMFPQSSLRTLLRRNPSALVLLALSQPYLAMVAHDLAM